MPARSPPESLARGPVPVENLELAGVADRFEEARSLRGECPGPPSLHPAPGNEAIAYSEIAARPGSDPLLGPVASAGELADQANRVVLDLDYAKARNSGHPFPPHNCYSTAQC
jgi:hypothetical protein